MGLVRFIPSPVTCNWIFGCVDASRQKVMIVSILALAFQNRRTYSPELAKKCGKLAIYGMEFDSRLVLFTNIPELVQLIAVLMIAKAHY
jgi:hypothetical protein